MYVLYIQKPTIAFDIGKPYDASTQAENRKN